MRFAKLIEIGGNIKMSNNGKEDDKLFFIDIDNKKATTIMGAVAAVLLFIAGTNPALQLSFGIVALVVVLMTGIRFVTHVAKWTNNEQINEG